LHGRVNTTAAIIKINRNSSIPVPNQQMYVFGWGSINPENWNEESDVLRETDAYYIPNEECKKFVGVYRNTEIDFQGEVIDATLCAMNFQNLSDSCRGDSGGGLIIKGQSVEEDVLVGIVSAGYGCANPTLPAMYARVSEVHEWIRELVCDMSEHPPAYLECSSGYDKEENNNGDGSDCQDLLIGRDWDVTGRKWTSLLPTDGINPCTLEEPVVELQLELFLDTRPEERGWILRTKDSRGSWVTMIERPIFTYKDARPMSTITETFAVPSNREYELILLDSYGDGSNPMASISQVVRVIDDQGNEVLSIKDFTDASYEQSYHKSSTFTVGVPLTSPPSVPPSAMMTPTSSPGPFISVIITFDKYPENIGFRVETFKNSTEEDGTEYEDEQKLLYVVYPGTFSSDLASTELTVVVSLNVSTSGSEMYLFTMTSNEGHGLYSGSYEVWLGDSHSGEFLFEGGDFYYEEANMFDVDSWSSLHFQANDPPSAPPSMPPPESLPSMAGISTHPLRFLAITLVVGVTVIYFS
jgi:hypothetical protein